MKKNVFFRIVALAAAAIFCFAACGDSGDDETAPLGIEMVEIEGGTFTMGSPAGEANRDDLREGPQHEVNLTGFKMGKYLVTQAQYRKVMGINPSFFKGDDLPVEQVSWYDAVEFCNMLSVMEGLTQAYNINKNTVDVDNTQDNPADPKWLVTPISGSEGYRLPTEAQWEYACRAGTTTPFSTGETINTDQANYNGTPYIQGEAPGLSRGKTTEVGSFPPNPWGLYDMHGNVYEWCWDRLNDGTGNPLAIYNENYYETAPNGETDPQGLVTGDRRVERGGSWNHPAYRTRSAWRERARPQRQDYNDLGFRVVLPLSTW